MDTIKFNYFKANKNEKANNLDNYSAKSDKLIYNNNTKDSYLNNISPTAINAQDKLATSSDASNGTIIINYKTIDFNKIANTASNALNGDYVKINENAKEYWKGKLSYTNRDDGSILISAEDGTALGFITKDSLINQPNQNSLETNVVKLEEQPKEQIIEAFNTGIAGNAKNVEIESQPKEQPLEAFNTGIASKPEEDIEFKQEDIVSISSETKEVNPDVSLFSSGGELDIPFSSNADKIYITSLQGDRNQPTDGASTNHKGVDIVAENSDKSAIGVLSLGEGVVTYSKINSGGIKSGYGNYIVVKYNINGEDISVLYGHLEERNFKEGDTIHKGDLLGNMGSTGVATGAHLHIEMQKGDWIFDKSAERLNPTDYLVDDITKYPVDDDGHIYLKGFTEESDEILLSSEAQEETNPDVSYMDLGDEEKINLENIEEPIVNQAEESTKDQVGSNIIGVPVYDNISISDFSGNVKTKSNATGDGYGDIRTVDIHYDIVPDGQESGPYTISQSDFDRVAAQIAGESANDIDDMLGVATTIANRMADSRFPDTPIQVLEEGYYPYGKSYIAYEPGGANYNTEAGQQKLNNAKAILKLVLKDGVRNLNQDVFYYGGDGTHNYFSTHW